MCTTGTKVWAVIQYYFTLDSKFYAIYIEKCFTKLKNAIMQEDTKEMGRSRYRCTQQNEKCSLDKVLKGEGEVVELEMKGRLI